MKIIQNALIVSFIVFLSGCHNQIMKIDLAKVESVGIINKFPNYPNYLNIGTTIFNNSSCIVEDITYKKFLTEEVEKHLQRKGFKVKHLLSEKSASNVDMIIEILPRSIYGIPNTKGYGFFHRSLLGISAKKKSYVALSLNQKKDGKEVFRLLSCIGEIMTNLPIDEMPLKWNELNESKKKELGIILKKDITKAVSMAFSKLGL